MFEGAIALAVAGDGLAFAEKFVLVGGEPFEAYRTARVQFPGADTEFGAQTVSETVGESCRSILKNSGRIHEYHEARGNIMAFRHDGFRVPRAVAVDVLDRFIDAVHDLDRNDQVGILLLPIVFRRGENLLSSGKF